MRSLKAPDAQENMPKGKCIRIHPAKKNSGMEDTNLIEGGQKADKTKHEDTAGPGSIESVRGRYCEERALWCCDISVSQTQDTRKNLVCQYKICKDILIMLNELYEKVNTDPVFVRIEKLLEAKHVPQKDLLAYLHMNRATYNNWKLNKSKSYLKRIDDIAAYLDISPNYLIRGIEDGPPEKIDEIAEDEIIRKKSKQECLIHIGRVLLEEELTE